LAAAPSGLKPHLLKNRLENTVDHANVCHELAKLRHGRSYVMVRSVIELRNVAGTEAAMGWAGGHTVVIDRPEGKAGGLGLGFNGGQMLALAIGGCYCNDLRYVAHERGVKIEQIAVTATLDLEGVPLVATKAVLSVKCETSDGSDPKALIDHAWSVCTVANSLNRGIPTIIQVA
jgi:organic hydroperoxide reductase OsmC/OhrA